MNHVFSNRQTCHVWAQQRAADDWGRAAGGSISFRGPVLYSYATPIARFVWAATGPQLVALFSEETYSPTTSRHISHARSAVNVRREFSVPTIDRGGYGQELDHAVNLAFLVATYEKRAERLMHCGATSEREFMAYHATYAQGAYVNACEYAQLFGLPTPSVWCKPEHAIRQALMRLRALNSRPATLSRLERTEARIAAAEVEATARDADKRARWLAGDMSGEMLHAYIRCESGGALLRIDGSRLVTSWGAEVPLAHARRAFRFYEGLPRPWARDASTITADTVIGHFTLDSVDADGNVRIGCHLIYRAELLRVLGVPS